MNVLPNDKVEELRRLIATGHSLRAAAIMAGVNRETVSRWKQKLKWQAAYEAVPQSTKTFVVSLESDNFSELRKRAKQQGLTSCRVRKSALDDDC